MVTQNNDKVVVETVPVHITTYRENWEVMRPFVHFAFKAIVALGGALISIVKLLPILFAEHQKNEQKKTSRIINVD